jgi:hypothetical protein
MIPTSKTTTRTAALCALLSTLSLAAAAGCGDDDAAPTANATAGSGGSGNAGAEAGGTGARAGAAGSESTAGAGGSESTAGAGGSAGAAGKGGGQAGSGGQPAPTCGSSADQVLGPIDSVSTGAVTVLEEKEGYKILFVDASAGGVNGQDKSPRLYLDLATSSAAAVTDESAKTSTAWDLALKRPVLFTNSGDGGPGAGGLAFLADKTIDQVVAADASGAVYATESFFDADCEPILDQMGAISTSFAGWYGYDTATNTLAPTVGTYLVRGGKGAVYKVQILSYYATPTGEIGASGGRYKLAVGPL